MQEMGADFAEIRRWKSPRCEVSQPAQLREIAVKTHEICMCNKGIISSQMFFAGDTKVRNNVAGQQFPPDVSTGQSAGAPLRRLLLLLLMV